MKEKPHQKNTHVVYIVLIAAAVVIFILSAGYYVWNKKTDVLKGTWSIDGITSFWFDGRGEGTMILPSSEYSFHYEIDGTMLQIDFEDEYTTDAVYEFQIEKETLLLTVSGDGGGVKNLSLDKVEE